MPRVILLPRTSGRVSVGLLLSLALNAALAGGLAYLYWQSRQNKPAPDFQGRGQPRSTDTVEALGRVQPISGLVNIFGPPGDQLQEWLFKPGETVQAGTILAKLRGERERLSNLAALDAQIAEAEALRISILASRDTKLEDLKHETEQALKAAEFDLLAGQSKIAIIQDQLKQLLADQARLQKIESDGVPVSAQEREQLQLGLSRAQQELNAAEAQKRKAEQAKASSAATVEIKRKLIEAETNRAIAQVPLKALQASRAAAEQKIRDALITAPINGELVKINAKPGETLTNMPAAQFADTSRMVVVAEVYETEIPKLRQWLTTSPTITALIDSRILTKDGTKLNGTTTAAGIGKLIAKNTVFALGPREDADRRVIEVEVLLDAASAEVVRDMIGLQVRVSFQPPRGAAAQP